ncbi:MAG: TIR domain-containing protein [Bacteroidota bacterium]|jgi:tetratricopeptide (TPR) repeat protein
MKSDVFVSYAHEDKKIADRIREDLTRNKIAVWIDEGKLRAGHPLVLSIQEAIRKTAHFLLLWSKSASRSRWVNAEWIAAWHLEKNIIPCTLDKEPVPPFLLDMIWCSFGGAYAQGLENLLSALKAKRTLRRPARPVRSGNLLSMEIFRGQDRVLNALDSGNLKHAKIEQKNLDKKVVESLEENPADADLLNLAAYHKKNAFQIKHWNQLQSRQYPRDGLLDKAETLFYESLAIKPDNPGAVNGLGSVLALRGDLDAAEFFVRRAIDLAKKQGIEYGYAKEDLATIRQLKKARA